MDWGSGAAAFDGLNVVVGQELLDQSGALRLVKGAKAMALGYDANGNMTSRVREGEGQILTYDVENRLVKVEKSGATLAEFFYDGDGNRVKGLVGGVTTVYIGDYFEWTGSTGTMKKYYYAGGQRVAMREGASTRYFLLTDHLGSTAITANGTTGAWVGEVRYKAWGEERYTFGTTPTTYRYTGQRWEVGPGLYFYRARWYDPALGRFIQADTIVPPESKQVAVTPLQVGAFEPEYIARVAQENREIAAYGYSFQRDARTLSRTTQHSGPLDPQALNRYSYASNRPLIYTDPTGHYWVYLNYAQVQQLYEAINDFLDNTAVKGAEIIENTAWLMAGGSLGAIAGGIAGPWGAILGAGAIVLTSILGGYADVVDFPASLWDMTTDELKALAAVLLNFINFAANRQNLLLGINIQDCGGVGRFHGYTLSFDVFDPDSTTSLILYDEAGQIVGQSWSYMSVRTPYPYPPITLHDWAWQVFCDIWNTHGFAAGP